MPATKVAELAGRHAGASPLSLASRPILPRFADGDPVTQDACRP